MRRKNVAALLHVYPGAAEPDAFQLQQRPLLESGFAGKQDLTALAKDPLPGNTADAGVAQRPSHLSRRSRVACGPCHIAVGCNLASGNHEDRPLHVFEVAQRTLCIISIGAMRFQAGSNRAEKCLRNGAWWVILYPRSDERRSYTSRIASTT